MIMIIIIFRISFIKRIGAQLQNTIGFLLNVELYNFFYTNWFFVFIILRIKVKLNIFSDNILIKISLQKIYNKYLHSKYFFFIFPLLFFFSLYRLIDWYVKNFISPVEFGDCSNKFYFRENAIKKDRRI